MLDAGGNLNVGAPTKTSADPRSCPRARRRHETSRSKIFKQSHSIISQLLVMFEAPITRVNVTPPAAYEFMRALEEGRELDCIDWPMFTRTVPVLRQF